MTDTLTLLSKLLANENISLQRGNYRTASFDIKERVLRLPTLLGMSESEELMLIFHEVGHAMFTDMTYVAEIEKHKVNKRNFGDYMNALEDVRIERKIKTMYPGSRRDFFTGYKSLVERDFFGVKNMNVTELPFIDRINLYYKAGGTSGVKFSADEIPFVREADTTNTIAEVAALAERIYMFAAVQHQKKQTAIKKLAEENPEPEDDEGAAEDSDEDEEGEIQYIDVEFSPEAGFRPEAPESRAAPKPESQDDTASDENPELTEAPGSRAASKPELTEAPGSRAASKPEFQDESDDTASDENPELTEAPASTTQSMFDENLVASVSNSDTVFVAPELGSNHYLVTFDQFTKEQCLMDAFLGMSTKRTGIRRAASYMHREFEIKKSATRYARQTQSRSGALDMRKLHQYKTSDDIFRKYNVVLDDKDHGMVVLLDFSGSMTSVIKSAIAEIYTLVTFCNMAKIPFRVFMFADSAPPVTYNAQNLNVPHTTWSYKPNTIIGRTMTLVEIATSDVPFRAVEKAMEHMMLDHFGRFRRTNTPLCEALIMMLDIIPKFKSKYNLQKVSLITITDGAPQAPRVSDGNGSLVYSANPSRTIGFLADPVTHKKYPLFNYNLQHILVKLLKERYSYLTTIGYFIVEKFSRRDIGNFVGVYSPLGSGLDAHNTEITALKSRMKDQTIKAAAPGYDSMMIFAGNSIENDFELLGLHPKSTTAAVAKEFAAGMKAGIANKVVLSTLVSQIS